MNLRIEGRNIELFNDFNFTLAYNSIASVFNFKANFDPNNSEHRIVFKPLSYRKVVLEHNGELIITGTLQNHNFNIKSTKGLSSFSAYSLPGVLEDCPIGLEQYPLEFNNLSLKEIIQKVIEPHVLSVLIDSSAEEEANLVYPEITTDATTTIKKFISDLAFQRGLILTHNTKGALIVTKTNTKRTAVVNYTESKGVTEISLSVAGQRIHSVVHSQQQADEDEESNASESTLENPLVSAYRPIVKIQNSGNDIDTEKFNRSVLGGELRSISAKIKVYQWEWIKDGKLELIRPNNIVSIVSPNNFLFKQRNFFVESVSFKGNQKEQTAILSCVPIEVYDDSLDLSSLKGFFDD